MTTIKHLLKKVSEWQEYAIDLGDEGIPEFLVSGLLQELNEVHYHLKEAEDWVTSIKTLKNE